MLLLASQSEAGALAGAGLTLAFLCVAGVLYFAPSAVALLRGHPNTAAIVFLNLFVGWTFVGWVVAMCWSLTNGTQHVHRYETRRESRGYYNPWN